MRLASVYGGGLHVRLASVYGGGLHVRLARTPERHSLVLITWYHYWASISCARCSECRTNIHFLHKIHNWFRIVVLFNLIKLCSLEKLVQ